MGARPRSWWQQISTHPVASVLIALLIVVIALSILSVLGYIFNWDWVGLGPYVSSPHPNGSIFQRGKTLWDWLQLLIIPAVLAVGGFIINLTISRGEQEATKQRAKIEREIAEDNQREAALQAYIDKMAELLLEKKLRDSKPEDEVRKIARVRTLTVLPRLDSRRKKSILQFLYESGLIEMDKSIIDLQGADLSRAILEGADLRGANLHEAIMEGTNLEGANLIAANLEGANLSGPILRLVGLDVDDPVAAMLMEANLTGADLRRAKLMATRLVRANLSRTVLLAADLYQADLQEADLSRACLGRANLYEASLRGANLYGADLNGANLEGADLSGANLEGADLGRANLRLTNVTIEQLNQAMSLQDATMHDGSKHL